MADGAPGLDAPVAARAQHLPVGDQHRADGDAPLVPAEAGLLDRELEEAPVAGVRSTRAVARMVASSCTWRRRTSSST